MKTNTRIVSLLLVVMLLFAAVGGTEAFAADVTVKAMKADTYYKTDNYKSEKSTLYKLKIDKDSVVKISWTNCPEYVVFNAYKDTAKNKNVIYFSSDKKSGSETYALSAGTYYFYARLSSMDLKGKYKVTVTAIKDTANYCKAKAKAVQAGKKVVVTQSIDYNYTKWYKITLKSKKKISITAKEFGRWFTIYNSKMEEIPTAYSENTAVTEKALKAGTYYVAVREDIFSTYDYGKGSYITFSWK